MNSFKLSLGKALFPGTWQELEGLRRTNSYLATENVLLAQRVMELTEMLSLAMPSYRHVARETNETISESEPTIT